MSVQDALDDLLGDLPPDAPVGDLRAILGKLDEDLRAGTITDEQFILAFEAELGAAYLATYLDELPDDMELQEDEVAKLHDLVLAQRDNITSFAADTVKPASEREPNAMPMETRLDAYADSDWAARQLAVIAVAVIEEQPLDWIPEEDPCEPCRRAGEGSPYASAADLPGTPGDDVVCEGWTNCRCEIRQRQP